MFARFAPVAGASLALAGTLFLQPATAQAVVFDPEPIDVGSGASASFVQFDSPADNTYLFRVHYDPQEAPSAFDLLTTLDTDPQVGEDFDLHARDFGGNLGQFVFGLTFRGDGFDDVDEDFAPLSWAYWTRDNLRDAWSQPDVGISFSNAEAGDWHGFTTGVFPDFDAPNPVPEPATVVLLAGGALVCLSRRRS